jgi:hypothetical protein
MKMYEVEMKLVLLIVTTAVIAVTGLYFVRGQHFASILSEEQPGAVNYAKTNDQILKSQEEMIGKNERQRTNASRLSSAVSEQRAAPPLANIAPEPPKPIVEPEQLLPTNEELADDKMTVEDYAASVKEAGGDMTQVEHFREAQEAATRDRHRSPFPSMLDNFGPEPFPEALREDLRASLSQAGASDQDIKNQLEILFPMPQEDAADVRTNHPELPPGVVAPN